MAKPTREEELAEMKRRMDVLQKQVAAEQSGDGGQAVGEQAKASS